MITIQQHIVNRLRHLVLATNASEASENIRIDEVAAVELIDYFAHQLIHSAKEDLNNVCHPQVQADEMFELWQKICAPAQYVVQVTLTDRRTFLVRGLDEDEICTSIFDSDSFINGDEELEIDDITAFERHMSFDEEIEP